MNDIIDMSHFVEAKSDQLNADDLIGSPRTITVRKVTGNDGEQPVSIYFEGDNNKPFKPCKTIRRVLLAIWGRNASEYVGRSMTIYRDDSVTFGGLATGGIRVSHMNGIDKETVVVVMKTKGKKAGIKIQPLVQEQRQTEDGAAKWATAFIRKVRACNDLDALAALKSAQTQRLAELAEKRPELAALIRDAVGEQNEFLTPDDDTQEGKPDTERGEGFADDDA